MSYTVDQIVNEIRNYHRTVSDMRSEFQAWKDEVRQEIAELKLMVERNTFINHPAPQGKRKSGENESGCLLLKINYSSYLSTTTFPIRYISIWERS